MNDSLVGGFLDTAERYPERMAIASGESRATYERLACGALSIAGYLEQRGFVAGDRAALVLGNNWEYYSAYFGVLMLGGIVVPLNPAAKAHDHSNWLAHADVRCVFGRAADRELIAAVAQQRSAPVWVADGAGKEGVARHELNATLQEIFHAALRPHNVQSRDGSGPACILYTSGTTGAPKGVLLSHANLTANMNAIICYLQLSATDSIVSVLPFSYSYGQSVALTHLRVGGRVVVQDSLAYPHLVMEALSRERSTGFAGVPSTYALLTSRVKLADYDLSSLRYITQAGGPMSVALTQVVRRQFAARLFVMYGQTEASARLTYLPPEKLDAKIGAVGVPVEGVKLEIRDDDGRPVGPDVTGHVWVCGPNVMLGYWRNDTATRSVLRDGWLNTGDMGYLDGDGYLFLVGRRADIVKVGAHRVHPNDVEAVIGELPGIEEVAVCAAEDELLGQVIKAIIVLAAGSPVTELDVKRHCRERLAQYKVPKYVEFVESLPKTASGKVRRSELTNRVTT